MVRLFNSICLLVSISVISWGQVALAQDDRPDAATLLQQISKKYAGAKQYHIEATEEIERKSEFANHWDKYLYTALVASDKRYRYEAHTEYGPSLKISDGNTEIYYNADSHEYTQRSVQEIALNTNGGVPIYPWQIGLQNASTMLNILSKVGNALSSPAYLQDEDLSIAGKTVSCYVIKGKLKYRGGAADAVSDATYWVDKENLLIRKKRIRREGPSLISTERSIDNRTTLYTVMDLGPASVPDSSFSFAPPAGAKLIRQFLPPYEPKDQLSGSAAPALKLKNTNGKSVNLEDFRGKPVLLDFWATWCPPCVAALQPLKKLEAENAHKGLVILGIDEDDDAEIGNNYLAKHGVNWANFHDDGEIWRAFPSNSGIPYYVLIDGEGHIVLAKPSAEESELVTAIGKLPDISGKDAPGKSKPKP